MTKEQLISFEDDIAQEFNSGNIRSPIHLYSNNEEQMIDIFKNVSLNDWCLCTWRSHYQCLLKGVPPEKVKRSIMEGKSICLSFPEHRIISSAIVTGILPIAVGIGLAIKRSEGGEMVHCFMGDMTAEGGAAYECIKYSIVNNLPIRFIIEDNGKSVCTDTCKTWGIDHSTFKNTNHPNIYYYKYASKYPHAGAGKRVQF